MWRGRVCPGELERVAAPPSFGHLSLGGPLPPVGRGASAASDEQSTNQKG